MDKQKMNELLLQAKKILIQIKDAVLEFFSPQRILYLGVMFVAFVLLVLAADQVVMPWYTRHGETLEVPDVTGKRFETAKETLDENGLTIVKQGEKYDSNLPFGYVVDQNPLASHKVKEGRRVYVTLSIGEREVQVPDLVGLSETNADERLKSFGLRIGDREYEYVANEPADIVIAQSVEPRKMVKTGAAIDIKVSLGQAQKEAKVPSILGKTLDVAKREIQKSGLVLGDIKYQVSNDFLPNTVIYQSKEAGLKVARGDTINVLVTTVTK